MEENIPTIKTAILKIKDNLFSLVKKLKKPLVIASPILIGLAGAATILISGAEIFGNSPMDSAMALGGLAVAATLMETPFLVPRDDIKPKTASEVSEEQYPVSDVANQDKENGLGK